MRWYQLTENNTLWTKTHFWFSINFMQYQPNIIIIILKRIQTMRCGCNVKAIKQLLFEPQSTQPRGRNIERESPRAVDWRKRECERDREVRRSNPGELIKLKWVRTGNQDYRLPSKVSIWVRNGFNLHSENIALS